MAIGMQKQRNIQFALFERIGWGTGGVNGKARLYLAFLLQYPILTLAQGCLGTKKVLQTFVSIVNQLFFLEAFSGS
jgi:hypothetical protein